MIFVNSWLLDVRRNTLSCLQSGRFSHENRPPCCLFAGFVNQIDNGIVGDAAVQRQADLAGAAGGIAHLAGAYLHAQALERGLVEFGMGKATVASPAAAVDAVRHYHGFGALAGQFFQLALKAHLAHGAGGVQGHGLGQLFELERIHEVFKDKLHRLHELDAGVEGLLHVQEAGAGFA